MNETGTAVTPPRPFSARTAILIIVAAVLLVYIRTLTFDFVSYDDYDLIRDNQAWLGTPSSAVQAFTTHAFSTHRTEGYYYRPALMLSFMLDYAVWGANPAGYHLTGILLHAACAALTFLLLVRLGANRIVGLGGALLFALHPVQTEAVAWISGRNDILLAFWVLLMMYAWIVFRESGGNRMTAGIVSCLSAAAALATKEPAVVYLLLIPLYEFLMKPMGTERRVRNLRAGQVVMALLILLYFGVRMIIFGRLTGPASSGNGMSLLTRISQVPAVALEYVRLIVIPVHLSAEHPLDSVIWFSVPWYILWAVLLAGTGWFIMHVGTLDRTAVFGVAWCVTGILPALNVVPLAVPILEHRLYAVLPGVLILLARIAGDPGQWPAGARRPVTIAVVLALTAAATGSFLRAGIWKNSETLWLDTIRKAPGAGRPYFNLAGYYYEEGRYDSATVYITRYIALRPDQTVGYEKLRQIFVSTGKYPEAIRVCEELVLRQNAGRDPYIEADRIYGYLDQRSAVLDASFAPFTVRMGIYFESTGDTLRAAGYYRRATRLDADYGPAYFRLGRLAALHGDTRDAVALIERGRLRFPAPPEVITFLEQLQQGGAGNTGEPRR